MQKSNQSLANWSQKDIEQIVNEYKTSLEKGLSDEYLKTARELYGENKLPQAKGTHAIIRFLLQFYQPLVLILIAAGVVTFFLEEYVDSGVIFGVVILNAIVGFIQEDKAIQSLDALKKSMQMEAFVLRNGVTHKINAEDVVVGDVVVVQSGDKIPADLRLCKLRDLQVVESSLTGESLPIEKTTQTISGVAALADQKNMAFAGTYVTYGQATGVVVAVGVNTEIGKISKMIAETQVLETPLGKKINAFSQVMLYAIMAMATLSFGIGAMYDLPLIENFMAAVALAVGAIPEGLPAAMTTILAIGVNRMAKQHAIIRRLPVVETLGSATIVCSDKTGTLTENQMTVEKIFAGNCEINISGSGYKPEGEFFIREQKVLPENLSLGAKLCLRAGFVCNDSRLVEKENVFSAQGDPTEVALLVSGIKSKENISPFSRLDSIPFESQHQFMAVLAQENVGENVAYLKGSFEKIMEKCSLTYNENGELVPLDIAYLNSFTEKMAGEGLRVLAFSMKKINSATFVHADIETENIFLGLQGMIDPPRKEAIESVRVCKNAGIVVKMITGDHAVTAQAIAKKLGIAEENSGKYGITGKDLDGLTAAEFDKIVVENNVFARVTPEQKLLIVKSLQKQNNVVAMTGDGVNDAPALRQADIGVAMGITGTEVTKEAADMILTNDNFYTIRAAIEEGRSVYDNLIKFILWTLPTNFGEGMVILAAIMLNVALPILPVQILWINMTTAGFLGLTLAFEPKEIGIMERKPRNAQANILGKKLITRLTYVSFILMFLSFGFFNWAISTGSTLEEARTVAVTIFVLVEMSYLFNCRTLYVNVHKIGLFSNLWVWVGCVGMLILQLLYIYSPMMNKIFQSAPIPSHFWLSMIAAMFSVFFIVEIEKALIKNDR